LPLLEPLEQWQDPQIMILPGQEFAVFSRKNRINKTVNIWGMANKTILNGFMSHRSQPDSHHLITQCSAQFLDALPNMSEWG
jgi:hypothetical protein